MNPKNEYSRFPFSSIPCDLETGDTSEDSLVPILSDLITFSHSSFMFAKWFFTFDCNIMVFQKSQELGFYKDIKGKGKGT